LVLALYRLFRAVNERYAMQLVVLGALVSVPIVFVNVLSELAALVLARGADYLSGFDQVQREGLAYLFIYLHEQGIQVVSIFWGLWLFPFAMLVIRSGFMPRVLGAFLGAAGTAYLASSFAALLLPEQARVVAQWTLPFKMGEFPMIAWLLVWGARVTVETGKV
jgi:hypothetical protein